MPINEQMYDYANPYKLPYQGTWKPPATKPNFLGSDFNNLKSLLNTQMGGDPNKNAYRTTFNKQIGKQSSRAIKDINEQLASSGFRGSGANLVNDVFETQANATEGFENDLLKNDTQIKQAAIAQLLGLNEFEGTQNFRGYESDVQQDQWTKSFEEQRRQFNANLQYLKDNQPAGWEGLLGSLIGGGAQVGAAALLGSDKKLKKNIKKVAETEEGIPVVKFNYREGGKAEHIGFLSKDVKKKHPEAVVETVDYSKIPMKISKLLAA